MRWSKMIREREGWHQWFAWHPVWSEDGEEWIWLELVLRRERTSSSGQGYWEYAA